MANSFSYTKARKFTFIGSALLIVAMFAITFIPGLRSSTGGFNLGVDFQPGVSITVAVDPAKVKTNIEAVRTALSGMEGLQVQTSGDLAMQHFIVRVRQHSEAVNYATVVETDLSARMDKAFGAGTITLLGTTSVGPKFSQTLTQQAIWLVALALIFIAIYVTIRFRVGYAAGAMVATIHDTIFIIAFIGVSQMEVTSATIAAILTIIGYSLNDTIVVFDRIRENEKTMADHKLGEIIDDSITQTLSRTIMTSLTTLLAVIAIAVFTTGEIQDFAVALVVGIVVGTYSSIFMAAPVLLEWRAAESRRKKKSDKSAMVAAGAVQVGSDEEMVDDPSEVDADAIAEEIRRQRSDRKKF